MSETTDQGQQENRSPSVINTQIALDMLEYLRDNPNVCAWLSIHAGNHPYVRWSDDAEAYLHVRTKGYGEIEVQKISGASLTDTFAENPIDLGLLIAIQRPNRIFDML
jgi:hypothetical protein